MTPSSARVALLLPTLRMGGAEKNRVRLANLLARRGFVVDLVVRDATGPLRERVAAGVTIHDLRAPRVRDALVPLVRFLRTYRPAVLLTAMWPLTVVSITAAKIAATGCRVVVSEHTTLSQTPYYRRRLSRAFLRLSAGFIYRRADAVVAVSQGVADDLRRIAWPTPPRVSVIYNACGPATVEAPNGTDGDSLRSHEDGASAPRFIAVGNLKPAKDYETMLKALKIVRESRAASLTIVGSGPLEAELHALVSSLGLDDAVHFSGYVEEPDSLIACSDTLVLSSQWEGFPNVLVEALRMGRQVVSTDCPSGPAEILDGGRYGWLSAVGDSVALAANMVSSLQHPKEVALLHDGAARYAEGAFLEAYEALLNEVQR